MPVAKLKAPNTTEVVKAEEGNESLDTFIKQAIGKEPLFSFSRNDSSVQWIQLLQALDQQDGNQNTDSSDGEDDGREDDEKAERFAIGEGAADEDDEGATDEGDGLSVISMARVRRGRTAI
ncbi:hypothetical protein LWI29_024213 [Acer saccharum]|uniref:Uncharacterized protein n=1 Tax=Acer saccharum TaxID=4024 RepID=A0AA39VQD0_ACESA|nr:hypothetical protein LWI29_024213 [Acer saccharum]